MKKVKEEGTKDDSGLILDIRQHKCWANYVNPKSPTFANGYKSALKAGYTHDYARTITVQKFFKNKLRRLALLNKAERVLDDTLDSEHMDSKGKIDAAILRVKNDSAKFIAKTLGKEEGYTERQEVTGKDGEGIVFMPMELMEKYGLNLDNKSVDNLEDNEDEE